MWNTIRENDYAFVYVYKGICYQGFIVENDDYEAILRDVEVYDHEKLYKLDEVILKKEDIEVMGHVRYMDVEERIK